MQNTKDIFYTFLNKFNKNEFRTIGNEVQQSKTLEIQNAHFEVDKPWIVRAPNYDYYFIEANYDNDEELHNRAINSYYESRVKNTHLSKEYASNWILENMGANSVYEFMHQHKER